MEALTILAGWAANKDCQPAIAQQGGVAEIVKAMRLFPGSVDVQLQACRALHELATSKNNPVIEREGGIFMILQALRAFGGTQRLAVVAMQCITALAMSSMAHRRTIARKVWVGVGVCSRSAECHSLVYPNHPSPSESILV